MRFRGSGKWISEAKPEESPGTWRAASWIFREVEKKPSAIECDNRITVPPKNFPAAHFVNIQPIARCRFPAFTLSWRDGLSQGSGVPDFPRYSRIKDPAME